MPTSSSFSSSSPTPPEGYLSWTWRAPMMSFGGRRVDARYTTLDHPLTSMLVGFLSNALGLDYDETSLMQVLQDTISWSVREVIQGTRLVDFQKVGLDLDHMQSSLGWSGRTGTTPTRGGGSATSPHLTWREYLIDAEYIVSVAWNEAPEEISLQALCQAIKTPARPLYIGRKHCLPSRPMAPLVMEEGTLMDEVLEAIRLEQRCWYHTPVHMTHPPTTQTHSSSAWTPCHAPHKSWTQGVHRGQEIIWSYAPLS